MGKGKMHKVFLMIVPALHFARSAADDLYAFGQRGALPEGLSFLNTLDNDELFARTRVDRGALAGLLINHLNR